MEVAKTRQTTIEAFSAGKSKFESSIKEPCGASDSLHQRLRLSKQQIKMAATKLQFESRRKISTLKSKRRKIW